MTVESYVHALLHVLLTCVYVLKVRSTISDFAVFITIMIMVLVDYLMGIPSPKLNVPDRFEVGLYSSRLSMLMAPSLGSLSR